MTTTKTYQRTDSISKGHANAQNTLSFFLPTHKPNAEKKMKECFRQRFITTDNYLRNLK